MKKDDWRLTNQMNYLSNKKLIKSKFTPYNENWKHEHCSFCSERIDENTSVAYCTEDKYHWICKDCFNDFNDMFKWEVKNND